MAGEIQASFQTGKTVYARIWNRTGSIYNTGTTAFETYNPANYANYPVSLSEQGSSAMYIGTFPVAIATGGVFSIQACQQIGGSPAQSDPIVAVGDIQWNGAATIPLSDLITSGQLSQLSPIKIARGVQVRDFKFYLVSSLDHVTPFLSGTVSGQINRDNGTWGVLAGSGIVEEGNGFYRTTLTSGDLLCNTASLLFIGANATGGNSDPRPFSLVTQKTSGQ